MKMKSKVLPPLLANSACSVSRAGASRRSMRFASPAPVPASDARPFLAHIARDQRAVGGQCSGDHERAVPRERADLETPARADEAHQERHECALIRTDLHPRL